MSTFLYFAYGSNMSKRRLRDEKRAPSAKVVGTGILKDYCLTFRKLSKDGSGKCTIEYCKSGKVYGVLFKINEDQKCCLDDAEGLCKGYTDITVNIEIIGTKYLENYECGKTVCCVKTYKATNPCQNLKPYTWYKQHVLVGAIEQRLPPCYIDDLIRVDADKDYYKRREERELSIYKNSQC